MDKTQTTHTQLLKFLYQAETLDLAQHLISLSLFCTSVLSFSLNNTTRSENN
jgi:hypothetical protein